MLPHVSSWRSSQATRSFLPWPGAAQLLAPQAYQQRSWELPDLRTGNTNSKDKILPFTSLKGLSKAWYCTTSNNISDTLLAHVLWEDALILASLTLCYRSSRGTQASRAVTERLQKHSKNPLGSTLRCDPTVTHQEMPSSTHTHDYRHVHIFHVQIPSARRCC